MPGLPALVDTVSELVDAAVWRGPTRLMYGGDRPISVAAGGYDRVFDGLSEALSGLSDGDRAEVYGGTARRFYRF